MSGPNTLTKRNPLNIKEIDMRAEKEVSDAVKPGNRPAPLKTEGDCLMLFPIIRWMEVQRQGIHYYDVEAISILSIRRPFAFTLPHGDPRMKSDSRSDGQVHSYSSDTRFKARS